LSDRQAIRKSSDAQHFSMIDEDRSGFIDKDELHSLLKGSLNLTDEAFEDVFKKMDENGDNQISEEEYVAFMSERGVETSLWREGVNAAIKRKLRKDEMGMEDFQRMLGGMNGIDSSFKMKSPHGHPYLALEGCDLGGENAPVYTIEAPVGIPGAFGVGWVASKRGDSSQRYFIKTPYSDYRTARLEFKDYAELFHRELKFVRTSLTIDFQHDHIVKSYGAYYRQPVRLCRPIQSTLTFTGISLGTFPAQKEAIAACLARLCGVHMALVKLSEPVDMLGAGGVYYDPAAHPPNAWDGDAQSLVGCYIRLKWAKKHYNCTVTGFSAATGKHQCTYDDGDRRSYLMSAKKFEILSSKSVGFWAVVKCPASRIEELTGVLQAMADDPAPLDAAMTLACGVAIAATVAVITPAAAPGGQEADGSLANFNMPFLVTELVQGGKDLWNYLSYFKQAKAPISPALARMWFKSLMEAIDYAQLR
jgi:hypothetical protein